MSTVSPEDCLYKGIFRQLQKVSFNTIFSFEEASLHVMAEVFGLYNLSHITRKPVFGVSDLVRLILACSATEAS